MSIDERGYFHAPASAEAVVKCWYDGEIVMGEVPWRLVPLLTRDNVDAVLASLDTELRAYVIESARNFAVGPLPLFSNAGDHVVEMPEAGVEAFQDWLRRHPDEQLPASIVGAR